MKLSIYLQSALYEKLNRENNYKDRIKVCPHKGTGKIIYAPSAKGICDPTWVILECDKSIVDYYSWFLTKRGIKIEYPMWGAHISIVRGEIQDISSCENWNHMVGETISFYYGDLVTNGNHWWLEVNSPDLDALRGKLGLAPHSKFGFHMTLGKVSVMKG